MRQLLNDVSKSGILETRPNKHLNFLINFQDNIKIILKNLNNKQGLSDLL